MGTRIDIDRESILSIIYIFETALVDLSDCLLVLTVSQIFTSHDLLLKDQPAAISDTLLKHLWFRVVYDAILFKKVHKGYTLLRNSI